MPFSIRAMAQRATPTAGIGGVKVARCWAYRTGRDAFEQYRDNSDRSAARNRFLQARPTGSARRFATSAFTPRWRDPLRS